MVAGEDEQRRFWRELAVWMVVTLANLEIVIQASVAAGKVPQPFTREDVIADEDDGQRR